MSTSLSVVAFAVLATAALGCSGSSRSSYVPGIPSPPSSSSVPFVPSAPSSPAGPSDLALGELVMESSLAPTTAVEIALEASLAHMQPGVFAPPVGPILTPSGTPDNGSVVIDFGSGSILNKLTLTGSFTASWARTGPDSWSVTVTFVQFGMDSFIGGSSLLDGSLTLAVSVTGTTATASLNGSLTKTTSSLLFGSSAMTITPNISYTIDDLAGTSILDGSLAVDTGSGGWNVEARSLTFWNGSVDSGEFMVERTSFPSVAVTFTFTAPDEGTFLISPPGITGTFTL